MLRTAPLLLLLATGTAGAQEHESTIEPIVFDGIAQALDQRWDVPLGFGVDLLFTEIWAGVTLILRGNSEFGLYVEGDSHISWRDDDGVAVLYHEIEPAAGSGLAAMRGVAGLEVRFDLYEGTQTPSGNPLLSLPFFSEDINFEVQGSPFTPFMLPGDPISSQTLTRDSRDGNFYLPLEIPINLTIIEITITPSVSGYPQATSIFSGEEIVSYAGSESVRGGEIPLYEQLPEIEMFTEYTANVSTTMSYVFTVNLAIDVGIPALDWLLGGSIIGFDFDLFEYALPVFVDYQQLDFETEVYAHPLPMIQLPLDAIDFGTIKCGNERTFQYPVNNDGYLDLEGVVGIDGDVAFSAAPPAIAAVGGGQEAVTVTFRPEQPGDYEGFLLLQTNDPYEPYLEIPVTGACEVRNNNNGNNGDDNGTGGFQQGSSIYQGCGCAAPGQGPTGALPLVGLLGLVALRRRREQD